MIANQGDEKPEANSRLSAVRKNKKLRVFLIGAAVMLMLALGAFVAATLHVKDGQDLQNALTHIESGAIKNEEPQWIAVITEALNQQSSRVQPGMYSNVTTLGAVTYNSVLYLKVDGNYEYALTVGNERVHKRYSHNGRWWIQGKVLHTILLTGDMFLTSPAQRDKVTPARELIVDADAAQLTLKAHYGAPVVFVMKAQ